MSARTSRRRRWSFGEAFVAHSLDLRRSPAWRALPNNARRVLDRLELEHMDHGDAENGSLQCSYSDFEAAGLHRAQKGAGPPPERETAGLRSSTQSGGISISKSSGKPREVSATAPKSASDLVAAADTPPVLGEATRGARLPDFLRRERACLRRCRRRSGARIFHQTDNRPSQIGSSSTAIRNFNSQRF